MEVFLTNAGLYGAGTGAFLLSYLAFSPVTRDLVVFLSRAAQITIFRYRHWLWALGGICLGLLIARGTFGLLGLTWGAAIVGTAHPAWLIIVGFTIAVLSLAFWATYVPVVMAPPRNHKTVSAAEADKILMPDAVVLGLAMGATARAYPRHLIARPHWFNDIIDEKPLMISYCILCNSGQAFVARLKNGRPLNLRNMTAYNNNTVYCDVETGNFIQQLEGKVIYGPDVGQELESYPMVMARWAEWKRLYPHTTVYYAPPATLRDRVVQKMLETMIPIEKLAARAKPWHLLRETADRRLPAMAFVFGVEIGGDTCAFPVTALQHRPVINDTVGGVPIVMLFSPGRNIGQLFSRRVGSQMLTFAPIVDADDVAVAEDKETRTRWALTGRAIAGPLAGRQLETLPHFNQLFWFSWAAFKPATRINAGADGD